MKILITGGTGFIGEHFIPELLAKGHTIRLLVRNLEKAKLLFGDSCQYHVGDVTNKKSLEESCKDIDIIYHMVAKVGNELPSEENFAAFDKVNVLGTQNMIDECKQYNVKKFIFVSSIAAMGIVHDNPISEESQCDPYLPYQVSKFKAERLVLKKVKEEHLPAIIVRPTKVYGVGEHKFSYLTLAKLCKKGFYPKVGNGNNYTSNIYVIDLVQGLVKLLDNGNFGQIYILTSNDSISFENAGKVIAEVMNRNIKIIPIPAKLMIFLAEIQERVFHAFGKKSIVTKRNIEATVSDRVYDISKAKKELGFLPAISMEEGIRRVVEWYTSEKLL